VPTLPDPDKTTILVPDDYKAKINPHGVYRVVASAPDCVKLAQLEAGTQVLVNEAMVENISVGGNSLLLVLENHVYGVFEN
jgi:hypothetical protein